MWQFICQPNLNEGLACDLAARSFLIQRMQQPCREIDLHALAARRRQIASLWNVEDVQSIRPDLTEGQAWEVLQSAEKGHDATIGINWEVLECHAEMLFGDAPDTDDVEKE